MVSLYEISNRINCKFILFLYLIFPIIQLISYNLFEYTTWRIPPLRIFFLIYSSMATRSTGCYAKLDRSIYFSFAYSIDSDYAKNISSARDRAIVRRIYPAIIHVERATCDESNDTRRRQMEMTRLARCFVDEPLLRRGKRFEAKTWKRDGRPVWILAIEKGNIDFLPASISPSLSLFLHLVSLPPPLPVFLHLSISLPLAHAPSLFFFADKFSRLPFTTLPADSTRQSHAKRCYWPRICRNNCYDYRAEISFMNLDFFYVSVLISVGKEFSIGPGTGFTGAEL